MTLTQPQKSGLIMISKGYRPNAVTVGALFAKGLLQGHVVKPKLTEKGRYVVKHGCLPKWA